MTRMTKEGHEQIKADLRARGMRSRPGRPGEYFGPFKVKWYWWSTAESSNGRTSDSESEIDAQDDLR